MQDINPKELGPNVHSLVWTCAIPTCCTHAMNGEKFMLVKDEPFEFKKQLIKVQNSRNIINQFRVI